MKSLNEKRLKLLEETSKIYNLNNRAYNANSQCNYITPDGRRCAIGRLISKKLASELDKHENTSVEYVFSLLPKRLSKLGCNFLTHLQNFHDLKEYWNKTGMSKSGKLRYKEIKESINSNYY